MQALRTIKSSTRGATIGWVGQLAKIVEGNAKNGRDVEDPKLLNEVGKVSSKTFEKFIKKNILKSGGTIVLRANSKV